MSTVVQHPLAAALGYCAVVPGFLTPGECHELIAVAQSKGLRSVSTDYPSTYQTVAIGLSGRAWEFRDRCCPHRRSALRERLL